VFVCKISLNFAFIHLYCGGVICTCWPEAAWVISLSFLNKCQVWSRMERRPHAVFTKSTIINKRKEIEKQYLCSCLYTHGILIKWHHMKCFSYTVHILLLVVYSQPNLFYHVRLFLCFSVLRLHTGWFEPRKLQNKEKKYCLFMEFSFNCIVNLINLFIIFYFTLCWEFLLLINEID
jgi:hypothetical protein